MAVTGHPYDKPILQFGECCHYRVPNVTEAGKLVNRWEKAVWVGREDTGVDNLVLTTHGAVKARVVRRLPAEDQANISLLENVCGLPWAVKDGVGQGLRRLKASPVQVRGLCMAISESLPEPAAEAAEAETDAEQAEARPGANTPRAEDIPVPSDGSASDGSASDGSSNVGPEDMDDGFSAAPDVEVSNSGYVTPPRANDPPPPGAAVKRSSDWLEPGSPTAKQRISAFGQFLTQCNGDIASATIASLSDFLDDRCDVPEDVVIASFAEFMAEKNVSQEELEAT
jgi:hypothetical protein